MVLTLRCVVVFLWNIIQFATACVSALDAEGTDLKATIWSFLPQQRSIRRFGTWKSHSLQASECHSKRRCMSRTPRLKEHKQRSPKLGTIMKYSHLPALVTSYGQKTHLNVILIPSHSSKWIFYKRFPSKILYAFRFLWSASCPTLGNCIT